MNLCIFMAHAFAAEETLFVYKHSVSSRSLTLLATDNMALQNVRLNLLHDLINGSWMIKIYVSEEVNTICKCRINICKEGSDVKFFISEPIYIIPYNHQFPN